jgi:hypothetical protein
METATAPSIGSQTGSAFDRDAVKLPTCPDELLPQQATLPASKSAQVSWYPRASRTTRADAVAAECVAPDARPGAGALVTSPPHAASRAVAKNPLVIVALFMRPFGSTRRKVRSRGTVTESFGAQDHVHRGRADPK